MAWIKARHEDDLAGIAARLYHSNIILSDLDDTIAKSPMKSIAYGYLKRPDMLANPKFIAWCAKVAWKKARHGKKAESELLKDFVDKFITAEESDRITDKLTPEYVEGALYPAVKEFYSLLPDTTRVIVTRSIAEVADSYARALDFNFAASSVYNKQREAEFIMGMFPDLKNYAVFGDSEEDEEMVDFLRHELVKGNIGTLVSVQVVKSPKQFSPVFDCAIGRDYTPLIELVKKYFTPSSSSQ